MREHLDEDALLAFVEGDASDADAAAVNRHVDECTDCRQVLAEAARSYLAVSLDRRTAEPSAARGAHRDRYVALGVIGSGASGVVYAAFDTALDRKVALKLLRGETARSDRLLQEAQALARLAHPNVIAVHDVGTLNGRVFIAMEHVDGVTLARWLRTVTRSRPEIIAIFKDLARGLAAAHAAGIVHRDFKPDNVLVGRDGRPRIVDFGLAAALDGAGESAAAIVGTPAYMAPEQLRGEASGPAADQFSWCAALYEALYGESAYAGDTLVERTAEVSAGRIRPAARPGIPAWLRALVVRGLAVQPMDRHPSMVALASALDHDPSRARRRWLAAAAMAAAVSATAVTVYAATSRGAGEPVCGSAERELAGVWEPPRRQQLAAAFAATGLPFARDQLATVDAALDRYTRGWVQMRTEACEATRVRGEQSDELLDLRMQCLDGRLQRVSALADALVHADATVVEHAAYAVQALPALEGCADAAALRSSAQLPADLGARARIAALRARLGTLRVERDTGHRELAAPSTAAVAEARALAYRPLEAEALALQALVATDAGAMPAAEQAFRAALVAAEAAHRDDLTIAALTGLTFVVGYGAARFAEGEAWSEQALAVIEGSGGDPVLRAHVLDDRGSLRFRQGKYPESIADHREAVALLEHALGPDHLDVANVANNLGAPLEAEGDFAGALAEFERAHRIYEAQLGGAHPDAIMALDNAAAAQRDLGRFDAAAAQLERALAAKEALYGKDAPALAATLANLGGVLTDLGAYDRAQDTLERAIAIRERVEGPDPLDATPAIGDLGNLLLARGRTAEAIAQYRRAFAIKTARLPPDHPKRVETLIDLAEAERIGARPAAALDDYRAALALCEPSAALHRYVAYALTGLGDCELDRGAPAAAIPLLTRALALREGQPADDPDLARTRFALARALRLASGDRARARELAQAARAGYADHRGRAALARIDAWLAAN